MTTRVPPSHLWNHHPEPAEAEPVLRWGAAPKLPRGRRVSVLTWNVQYAGTRRHRFFYDGGRAVWVPRRDVEEALGAIIGVIREVDADLVLLQEVDRGSDRTGRIDQWARIVEGCQDRWPRAVGTCYHRSRYVPTPWWRPLGRVDFWMGTLSRFEMTAGRRIALAPMRESAIRQRFNLKRALLEATLPIEGERVGGDGSGQAGGDGGEHASRDGGERGGDGKPIPANLRIGNTHLSAFSNGDGTLDKQIAQLCAWADLPDAAPSPILLGGDLNLLPDGDDPARLPDAASWPHQSPISHLAGVGLVSAIPGAELLTPASRTYLPPGANAPDRVLDYIFGRALQFHRAEIVPIPAWLSDHLPIRAEFSLL